MKPEFFIGVDISKLTLDLAVVNFENEPLASFKIANTETSIIDILSVIKSNHGCLPKNTCFCAEDMGLYASYLRKVLGAKKYKLCLESPLRIKRSIGIQRGKNDSLDAVRIARYACSNYSLLHIRSIPRPCIMDLKNLATIRKRLLKTHKMLTQPKKIEDYYQQTVPALSSSAMCSSSIAALQADIKMVERRMDEIIATDEHLSNLLAIMISIPRIGKVTATQILIATNEFKWICCPKKFASFCGVAPFQFKSGTSLNSRARVSNLANRELKSLIHMAAVGYAKKGQNDFLGKYYKRKIQEGKKPMSVLNAVRNKLIQRIFACVKAGTYYVDC
nr:transposase [uncultured Dyadobacter sp.]